MSELSSYKPLIAKHLTTFLGKKTHYYAGINVLGENVLNTLNSYAASGKMIRGSLFLTSSQLLRKEVLSENALKIACSLELIQSALLIHDDIMDQDATRRGKTTIHKSYAEKAEKDILLNPSHFGNSMAICIGDIAFFLAFELISSIEMNSDIKDKLLHKLTTEIQAVGLAQMQDVLFGASNAMPSTEEILHLYAYKTARYTFSLPLSLAAIFTHQKDEVIMTIEKIGELLGVIFQIKDDELDLFGKEEKIGKPIGSDIKEKKKTLHYIYLLLKSNDAEREKILDIYKKNAINQHDIEIIQALIEKNDVKKYINEEVAALASITNENIKKLPKKMRVFLEGLLLSMNQREK